MENIAKTISQGHLDAYNLGRAMSLIEGLIDWPDNPIVLEQARKFLAEMREEKS